MVIDYLTELAIDVVKGHFKDKVDKYKLKKILIEYLKRQEKYNEICKLAEEIDFQGLIEYVRNYFLSNVEIYLFAVGKEKREQAKDSIVNAAVAYSKAETNQEKERVAKCIFDCLDLIEEFYSSDFSKREYIFASKVVDAVADATQQIVEEGIGVITSKVDHLEKKITDGLQSSADNIFSKNAKIPEIQKRYLNRLQKEEIICGNCALKLNDIYVPNLYKIGDLDGEFDDLFELIASFEKGKVNEWLEKKGIPVQDKIHSLLIFGYQCSGKSTLISRVIANYYSDPSIQLHTLHVVSIGNSFFRHDGLSVSTLCNFLGIGVERLEHSLLLIDGIDESDYSYSEILIQLENLLIELQGLDCRPIITSRPNLLLSRELRSTLSIFLQPFSQLQAISWVKKYGRFLEIDDTAFLEAQIKDLSPKVRNIILIPYIFRICILHKIALNEITELPKLYDILFCGPNAMCLENPYNSRRRLRVREWEEFIERITDISISCYKSKSSSYSFSAKEMYGRVADNLFSEFFIIQIDNGSYSFVHNSIPYFFIARAIFLAVKEAHEADNWDILTERLFKVTANDEILSTSIIEFLEYFANNGFSNYDFLVSYLKLFLNKQLVFESMDTSDLDILQACYYRKFVSIVRIVFAFVVPNLRPFAVYNLFSFLNDEERKQFIRYTCLGSAPLDCLKKCELSNIELDGINLSKTELTGSSIISTKMRHASLQESTLSGAYLLNSDFTLSNFDNSQCRNADFSNCILFGCSFRNARVRGSNFTNTNMCGVDLRGAEINKCTFSGATLFGMKISANQLRYLYDFDVDFVKDNHIEIYNGDKLVPNECIEEIFRNERPVAAAFQKYKKIDD